eukprot:GGOE01041514.1.p1 GENE.GGOE01041514.1~~GGOE01041514.1.p1  ORF type:complete len:526 (-),score=78.86 GGOE01041514.1:210-1787(-)
MAHAPTVVHRPPANIKWHFSFPVSQLITSSHPLPANAVIARRPPDHSLITLVVLPVPQHMVGSFVIQHRGCLFRVSPTLFAGRPPRSVMDGTLLPGPPPAHSPLPARSLQVALVCCLCLVLCGGWERGSLVAISSRLSVAIEVVARPVTAVWVARGPPVATDQLVPTWVAGGTPRFFPPSTLRKEPAASLARNPKAAAKLKQPTAAPLPHNAAPLAAALPAGAVIVTAKPQAAPPGRWRTTWPQKRDRLQTAMRPFSVRVDTAQLPYPATPDAFRSILTAYCSAAEAAALSMPPSHVCRLAVVLVQLGADLQLLYDLLDTLHCTAERLMKVVLNSAESVSGIVLIDSMRQLSFVGAQQSKLVDLLGQRLYVDRLEEELGVEEVLEVVRTLARCGLRDPALLASLARRLAHPALAINAADLVELVETYATLRALDEPIGALLRQRALSPVGLSDFTSLQLLAMARACATLHIRDEALLAAIGQEAATPEKRRALDTAASEELEGLLAPQKLAAARLQNTPQPGAPP